MKQYLKYFGCYFILIFSLLLCAGCGGTSETSDSSSTQVQGDALGTQGSLLTASQWQNGFRENASMSVAETNYYELRRSVFQSPDIDFEVLEKKEVSSYA